MGIEDTAKRQNIEGGAIDFVAVVSKDIDYSMNAYSHESFDTLGHTRPFIYVLFFCVAYI